MSYYAYTPSRHNERPDPADMQRPDREQQYHLERKYRVFYVFSYLKRLASHLVHILGSSEVKSVARFSALCQMRIKETQQEWQLWGYLACFFFQCSIKGYI